MIISKIDLRTLLLICVLLLGLAITSCADSITENKFEYTARTFEAKIVGTVDGEEVAVRLQNRPGAVGEGPAVVLSFEAPGSLRGIVISQRADGTREVRLGELVLHNFHAEGLLEPFLTLLYSGEVTSARRDENRSTVVSVQNGEYDLEYLFLKGYDYPYSVRGVVCGRETELFVQSIEFTP